MTFYDDNCYYDCRTCSASTKPDNGKLPVGWKKIARIDGPNAICPACVGKGVIALFDLKYDGYEFCHIVDAE